MRALAFAALAFAAAALILPAGAAPPDPGRYELKPADGGFLRLDRETGETAFCAPAGDGYACRPSKQAAAADPAEVARLEARIADLEARVRALSALPPVPPLPKDGATASPELRLPTDEEIDRLASFFERAARRFKRFADELERENQNADADKRL